MISAGRILQTLGRYQPVKLKENVMAEIKAYVMQRSVVLRLLLIFFRHI